MIPGKIYQAPGCNRERIVSGCENNQYILNKIGEREQDIANKPEIGEALINSRVLVTMNFPKELLDAIGRYNENVKVAPIDCINKVLLYEVLKESIILWWYF